MNKKYILTTLLFWTCSLANAQVMLPAYQGVFNKKALVITPSNGLDFDGVNDYAVNTSLVITPSLGFTIEGWMKIRDLGYSALATQTKTYLPAPFDMYVENGSGRLTFLVGQSNVSGSASGSTALAIGIWTHVAFVYDPAIAKVIIYVNGVQDGIGAASTPGNVAGSKFIIGNRDDLFTGLNGTLDDVRIWNVARTPSQILANMNNELLGTETGLKAYYTFNQGIAAGSNTAITTVNDQTINAVNVTLTNFAKTGTTSNFVVGKVQSAIVTTGLVLNLDAGNTASYPGTGTTWTDLSGLNNHGTLINSPTYNSSNGGNLVFNGSTSYISAPLTKAASCTFSVWAKTSTAHSSNMLFNAGLNGAGPDLFFYSGYLYWNTWDGVGNPFGLIPATTTNGNWHNYAVVNNAVSNNAKLYYDGVLIGTAGYINASTNTTLYIGGTTGTYMWNGAIATFYVYNRSLLDTEVLQNYNAAKSKFGY
jgi:hypothetical protein